MTRPSRHKLGAVLLAGGASRRFGTDNKLLADVRGTPLIAHTVRTIQAAGMDPLVVVTGAEHDGHAAALAGLPLQLISNVHWEAGMGTSISAGIRALPRECDGAFIVPADMPNLTAEVLLRLAEAFEGTGGTSVVVPVTAEGGQRNPVLWPRGLFADLATLSGPQGGKSLLDRPGVKRLDVAFADGSVFADIDTPEDYARFIAGAPG
jgi:molybdenum cofactor cytidylyltransferase